MHYRPLGRTGIKVSEIGMGCNRLGQDHQPQDFWIDLVRQAADLGVTIFDTAEAYEWGGSEEVLGLALGNRDDVYIATKMCRVRKTNARDYSANRMRETAEDSLRRLRRECIDIYQLHSPSRDDMERDDWVEGMDYLKLRVRSAMPPSPSTASLTVSGSSNKMPLMYSNALITFSIPMRRTVSSL